MANRDVKPKISARELVQKMKHEKGIKFALTTEKEAENYLLNVNNYLRTASYRKNFEKYQRGANTGKYVDLDFAYLQELSVLDMRLRDIIIKMSIDIEHELKVQIVKTIEITPTEDGYVIVRDFLGKNSAILKKIETMSASGFTSDLIQKYFTFEDRKIVFYDDCPAWVLMELLAFGDTIYFYNFLYTRLGAKMPIPRAILNLVRSLRNSCAHNNCLLSNLRKKTTNSSPELSSKIAKIKEISAASRKRNLSSRPLQEFAALVILYREFVSKNVRNARLKKLRELVFKRMRRHKSYFSKNSLLATSYEFVARLLIFGR